MSTYRLTTYGQSSRIEFGPCSKCGEADPEVNYRSATGGGRTDTGWPRSCSDMPGVEHFHIECRRCHYRWTAPVPVFVPVTGQVSGESRHLSDDHL